MKEETKIKLKEEVAEFIKVEEPDDDKAFHLAFEAAMETLEGAVGRFDEESARMRLALSLIAGNFYDNRSILTTKNKEKMAYVARTVMLQLQLDYGEEDGN